MNSEDIDRLYATFHFAKHPMMTPRQQTFWHWKVDRRETLKYQCTWAPKTKLSPSNRELTTASNKNRTTRNRADPRSGRDPSVQPEPKAPKGESVTVTLSRSRSRKFRRSRW